MKIMFFTSHFFNVNISVTIKHCPLKFSVLILTIIKERTLSQVFIYGLDFILCIVENIVFKKWHKVSCFLSLNKNYDLNLKCEITFPLYLCY